MAQAQELLHPDTGGVVFTSNGPLPGSSIQPSSADSRVVAGVFSTGGHQLTTQLRAAANGRQPPHAFTAGLQERGFRVLLPGWLGPHASPDPNLAGSLEDAVGGVGGAPPIVLGAGVDGGAGLAVALVALLAGAADFGALREATGVDVAVLRRANP